MPVLKQIFLNDVAYGETNYASDWVNFESSATFSFNVYCDATVDLVLEYAVDGDFQIVDTETIPLVGGTCEQVVRAVKTNFVRFRVINIPPPVDLKIQGYFYASQVLEVGNGGSHVMPIGELAYEDYVTGTTINVLSAGTKYLINTLDTLATNSSMMSGLPYFTNPLSGRLQYVGMKTQLFHTAISISAVATGGSGKLWEFELRKNGIKIPFSGFREESRGGSEFPLAYHVATEMVTNDYLEVFVSNETDTTNLTVENFNLFVMGSIGG